MSLVTRTTPPRRRREKWRTPECEELTSFCRMSRVERLRTMREFAEQEIVIPDGPYKNRRFSCLRQPFSRLWFDLVDSGKWQRYFAAGTTQSGKTLSCFVIPTMYHLFEIGETVICGLPSMDIAGDKWREDFLPAIEASRYKDLLPDRGTGSRGGKFNSIRFKNGTTLKFMSGGGGDKKRAAFTARVVVITEVDGMDVAGEVSREADPITQLEARTMAYGDRKRIYGECTVSIEEGRIWQEVKGGSDTRIALQCPHCFSRVSPERKDLVGWSEATSDMEAKRLSHFRCPECQAPWSETDRRLANERSIVLHQGQTVVRDDEGNERIDGEGRDTATLGFRWSGVNNLFQSAGDIGMKEYKATLAEDDEKAEKELQQFYWTVPHKPDVKALMPLNSQRILERISVVYKKKQVPEWVEHVTVGVDVGMWLMHWVVTGWGKGARSHICDYGREEVPTQELGLEKAILNSLSSLRSKFDAGIDGRAVEQCWVDIGYQQDVILKFILGAGNVYRPAKGFGTTQYRRGYTDPKQKSETMIWTGDKVHLVHWPLKRANVMEIDVDHWKSFVHARLSSPKEAPGSMTLFDEEDRRNHTAFAKHLTAERQVEEFVDGKGTILRWEAVREHNHWLDALMLSTVAAHSLGVRLIENPTPTVQPVQKREPLLMPDGRPYLVTER